MQISAEVNVSDRATIEIVSAASLPDMPVETPLFGRDRCRYVGRDAALSKYPVNSRSKISRLKLFNLFKVKKEYQHLNIICITSTQYFNPINSRD